MGDLHPTVAIHYLYGNVWSRIVWQLICRQMYVDVINAGILTSTYTVGPCKYMYLVNNPTVVLHLPT